MPDNQPYDDDAEFKAWRDQRQPPEEPVAPSVTFMEMMRQAAARSVAPSESEDQPDDPDSLPDDDDGDADNVSAEADADSPDSPVPPNGRRQQRERRRAERPRSTSALGGCLRSLIIVLTAAGLTATIFTWATPNDFIANDVRRGLSASIATEAATLSPTAQQTPNYMRAIGIISGHRGPENDPGAVCPDGLTEAEINLSVAQRVVSNMQSRGYTAHLLDEFDPRLTGYRAEALVSIHSNTCQDFGEHVSGFMIASASARISARGNDHLLVECIATEYAEATGLNRRMELTVDMTSYHTFNEIHALTPAAIIELGFMLGDRQILTEQPDVMARAITDGILCFLEPTTPR